MSTYSSKLFIFNLLSFCGWIWIKENNKENIFLKEPTLRTSLVVQDSALPNAGAPGLIPDWGTRSPCHNQDPACHNKDLEQPNK